MKNQESQFLLSRTWVKTLTDVSQSKMLTLLQWNILNPIYSEKERYPKVEEKYLDFDYRREIIKQEIQQLSPDIICLQEVNSDSLDFFTSFIGETSGYKNIYTKRVGKAKDGLLFAVKTAAIDLVESTEGKYMDLESNEPQGQVFQIHLLKVIAEFKTKPRYIVLTTTHLKAKEEFRHVRLAQVLQLKEAMNKTRVYFSQKYSIKDEDLIEVLSGDLNDDPQSEAIVCLKDHNTFESPFDYYDFSKFYIRKGPCKETIDYVLFAKRDEIKMVGYLDQISSDSLPFGLPSEEFPSDHIYLFAEFAFPDV